MAKFTRFEDIDAWKKARALAQVLRPLLRREPFSKDYVLANQIWRAAISIPSNIAEGYGRGGSKEFQQFLSIAKGSTSELRTQLYLAMDSGYLSQEEFDDLYTRTAEIARMISGLATYLRKSSIRGPKFKNP